MRTVTKLRRGVCSLLCNTCRGVLGSGDAPYQTLKNRRFGATLNKRGEVIKQCCELCAQEILDQTAED